MTTCAARSTPDGQIRCALCRITWDRDEVRVCAREVPVVPVATRAADERLPFASALAPDPFRR